MPRKMRRHVNWRVRVARRLEEYEPAGAQNTMGFVQHRGKSGTVRTRTPSIASVTAQTFGYASIQYMPDG